MCGQHNNKFKEDIPIFVISTALYIKNAWHIFDLPFLVFTYITEEKNMAIRILEDILSQNLETRASYAKHLFFLSNCLYQKSSVISWGQMTIININMHNDPANMSHGT